MDELNQAAVEQSSAEEAQSDNAGPVADVNTQSGDPAPGAASAGVNEAEAGNAGASDAGTASANDTALSANAALQEDGTATQCGSGVAIEVDHKSILENLFAELEGIVHLGKAEIVAIIDRAKALM